LEWFTFKADRIRASLKNQHWSFGMRHAQGPRAEHGMLMPRRHSATNEGPERRGLGAD
jgi:hypothetical protein